MGPIWFGPAGTADSFAAMGYKKTTQRKWASTPLNTSAAGGCG